MSNPTNEALLKEIESLKAELKRKDESIEDQASIISQLIKDIQEMKEPQNKPIPMEVDPKNKEEEKKQAPVKEETKDIPHPIAEKPSPCIPYSVIKTNFIENSKIDISATGFATIWFHPEINQVKPANGVLIVGEFTEYNPVEMVADGSGKFFINWKFPVVPSKNKFFFVINDTKMISKQYDLTKSFSKSKYPMNYVLVYNKKDNVKEIDIYRTLSEKSVKVNEEQRELFNSMIKMNEGVRALEGIKGRDILLNTDDLSLFEVTEKNASELVIKPLTDNNGLLLADANRNSRNISPQEIEAGLYLPLSKEEIDIFCNNLNERQLSIQYTVENDSYFPVKINKKLNLSQYDVVIKDKEIKSIRNPNFGEIKFKGTPLDKVVAYVKAFPMKIYYSIFEGCIFNLIHLHFNEDSCEAAIDLVYIKDDETEANYKKFTKDMMGNTLNYRILVKQNKIYKVLFNTGKSVESINFEAYEVVEGKLYEAAKVEGKIMRLTYIPVCLLAAQDPTKIATYSRTQEKNEKICVCSYKHPVEYQGFVDVEVIYYKGLVSNPMLVSIPACDIFEATQEHQNMISEQLNVQKAKAESIILEKVKEIKSYINTDFKALNDENKANLFKKINSCEIALNSMIQDAAMDLPIKESVDKLLEDCLKIEKELLPSYRIMMHSKKGI